MKFKHGTRRRALEYEKDWVQRWKQDGTFEKSVERRPKDDAYVFYDGPPFITGVPHHGTLLSSIVKDAIPRYQTMKGRRVERVWGWDCHGLPAENFVEKQLNITDRRQIVAKDGDSAPLDKDGNELPTISLEKYITKARESMVANSESWEDVIDRIGRWVDFKGAYRTMDKDFMESVWWAFKELYEKGKIYEGEKVLMYDTRFATPVSKNEVTMDNDAYQTVTDPSVYVKFKLKSEPRAMGDEKGDETKPLYMLAWTTTPWTLPGNTALAVNPTEQYDEYILDGERIIVAAGRIVDIAVHFKKDGLEYGKNPELVRCFMGKELVGVEYEPLIGEHKGENAHRVWAADYVKTGFEDTGTGIVHIAPAYGEEDFELAKEHDIPCVHTLDDNGYYYPEVAAELYKLMPWIDSSKPLEVWESNKNIAKGLEKAGIVWKIDYIRHEYPFNPRSKQRIMYRAIPSWFFDIQGSKPLMLEQNENVNWFPEHLKHGRFAKNIEQAPDWNLSRDRFWATAMPVWKGDKGSVKVVGSYAELKELSGVELDDYHRPWVDDITFTIDGEHFTRIDKVLDCWFESGSMPFAQLHYPFENQEKFEKNYPAEFITEYVPQVRAWFYYVHAVNTALFGEHAYSNVITTGTIMGSDGRKLSKSLGNFTDPNEVMDKFSADSLRFLLLSSPLLNGEDFAIKDKDVGDVARKLSMIWNMYDFFTMYAEVDNFEFPYSSSVGDAFGTANGEGSFPVSVDIDKLNNPLDIWIISRLHQLNQQVTENLDAYNIPDALSPILPFIDDASNWFVRRSRRRFWKSEDDGDKNDAYKTLHYVLLKLAAILAPITPFLAEELYQNLGGGSESIHLIDWPTNFEVNQSALDDMERTRSLINAGLGLRMKKDEHQDSIKVRQPLQFASYAGAKLDDYYEQIMAEELNVKEIRHIDSLTGHLENYDEVADSIDEDSWIEISKKITTELKREGLMREVIRFVQSARKNAGLNVDDRINLSLETSDADLIAAISAHRDEIYAETLAVGEAGSGAGHELVKVDGIELKISLEKA